VVVVAVAVAVVVAVVVAVGVGVGVKEITHADWHLPHPPLWFNARRDVMWTKHKNPALGRGKKRTEFAVSKSRPDGSTSLLVPESKWRDAWDGQRVDVLIDGALVGFWFTSAGAYKPHRPSAASATTRLPIPRPLAAPLPYGTTDCTVTEEDGMLVLDLAQFKMAAE
jgi:hypothetical protein